MIGTDRETRDSRTEKLRATRKRRSKTEIKTLRSFVSKTELFRIYKFPTKRKQGEKLFGKVALLWFWSEVIENFLGLPKGLSKERSVEIL